MNNLYISEILKKLNDFTGQGSHSKKVEWLQKNNSPALQLVLKLAYNDSVRWTIPEGVPKFKASGAPIDYNFASIHTETRKLSYLWLAPESGGRPMQLNKVRLESLFIQMLESLHPDEAAVVVAMKDKTLHRLYPLTKDIVRKAFPTLLPENTEGQHPPAKDK